MARGYARRDPRSRALTRREAVVLRELIRAGEAIVSGQELAWAFGDVSAKGKFHAHNTVGSIRRKFGAEVVVTVTAVAKERRGYRAGRALLALAERMAS